MNTNNSQKFVRIDKNRSDKNNFLEFVITKNDLSDDDDDGNENDDNAIVKDNDIFKNDRNLFRFIETFDQNPNERKDQIQKNNNEITPKTNSKITTKNQKQFKNISMNSNSSDDKCYPIDAKSPPLIQSNSKRRHTEDSSLMITTNQEEKNLLEEELNKTTCKIEHDSDTLSTGTETEKKIKIKENDDRCEDSIFGELVAAMLKKMPQNKKKIAKKKIMDILLS